MSSSFSFLFGNMSRAGFANTMILLGPWPNHLFKKPTLLRFSSSQESGGREGAAKQGALFQADGFLKPFQGEILRKEFLKNILHNLGFVKT